MISMIRIFLFFNGILVTIFGCFMTFLSSQLFFFVIIVGLVIMFIAGFADGFWESLEK